MTTTVLVILVWLLSVSVLLLCWIILRYRDALAFMYQYAGATNARVEVLDNLAALANGCRAPHAWSDLYPAGPEGITWNLYTDAYDWDHHLPGGDPDGIPVFMSVSDLLRARSCAGDECGAVRVSVTEIERISAEELLRKHREAL